MRLNTYHGTSPPPTGCSIHNDYQRHLGYLWVMPFFETSKMREWASGQAGDGHIQARRGEAGRRACAVAGN